MRKLNVMPVGAGFFDLLENVGIVSMLAMYPSKPVFMAWLTMIFGNIKWAFAIASIVLILIGFVK
jgi:hypothetical protein